MIEDRELEETLDRLAGPVDRSGVWASIETRAGVEPWTIGDRGETAAEDEAPTRARRLNLRVVLYASLAVVLVAAITVGSLEALKHLGKDQPILVITDETTVTTEAMTVTSTPAQTTLTTAGGTGTTETVAAGETPIRTSTGQWEWLPLTSEGGMISVLVIDPSDPSVLYSGCGYDWFDPLALLAPEQPPGLYKSTDGARTWSRLPKIEGTVRSVAVDPASPSTVYAITDVSGGSRAYDDDDHVSKLMRSDDGGATWTDLTDKDATGYEIWCDPTSIPSTVYTTVAWGYSQKVFRSTDRGETWTELSDSDWEKGYAARSVSPPPAAQQALDELRASFVERREDVVSSLQDSWWRVNHGFMDVLVDADTGALVEFRAEDVGVPSALLVDPSDLSIFYAGTNEGVYKSTDGGRTWKKASRGLVNPAVKGVAVDPSAPSTLYAATPNGIFRSTDGGKEWTLILGGSGSVVVAPSTPARVYAWTAAGLFRSDDRGESWTQLAGQGLPSASDVRGLMSGFLGELLLVVAGQPDTLFALFPDTVYAENAHWGRCGVLSRSTDGGNTWVRCNPDEEPAICAGLGQAVADPRSPSTIYLYDAKPGEPGHEFPPDWWLKSTDGGATWSDPNGKEHSGPAIWAIFERFSDGAVVHSAFVRSLDGGVTWEDRSPWTGSEDLMARRLTISINRMLFDPGSPDMLYVIGSVWDGPPFYGGVWTKDLHRSTDGGATWEDLTGVLSEQAGALSEGGDINDITVNPASGGTIYAATLEGLYQWVPDGE